MKVWNCPKKTQARKETIIDRYREMSGNHSIPQDRQYWAMCGQCTMEDGSPNDNSELGQMVSSGLITPEQFHGVEIVKETNDMNVAAYPDVNFYLGDFVSVLTSQYGTPGFNPAIINADMIAMKDKAVPFFTRILSVMSKPKVRGDLMVVCNLIRDFGCNLHHQTVEEVVDKFCSDDRYAHAMEEADWTVHHSVYDYYGTGKGSRTGLTTFVFYKRGA